MSDSRQRPIHGDRKVVRILLWKFVRISTRRRQESPFSADPAQKSAVLCPACPGKPGKTRAQIPDSDAAGRPCPVDRFSRVDLEYGVIMNEPRTPTAADTAVVPNPARADRSITITAGRLSDVAPKFIEISTRRRLQSPFSVDPARKSTVSVTTAQENPEKPGHTCPILMPRTAPAQLTGFPVWI